MTIFILIGAFAGSIVGIFYYHKWRMSDLRITGTEALKNDEVAGAARRFLDQKILYILPGDNFALLRSDALAANLAATLPTIKTIALDRVWPGRLDIAIKERKSWGIYCLPTGQAGTDTCFLIDEEGVAYAPAPAFEGSLIIKVTDERSGQQVHPGDKIVITRPVKEIYDKLSAAAGERLLGVTINTDTEWQAQSLSGSRILIDAATDLDTAAKNLKIVLQEVGDRRAHLDYIDLRYGRKIYYKLK
ncbi:MAG: FtsQ-type POTRA domain-containing protein [Candidatus Niyogibacteria bacterium]|nr:FtsQ-type POTRA domain-containing protein [Candidatus Niyogibacteria bacterium]